MTNKEKFIDAYDQAFKFKTNNNERSKETITKYKNLIEKYLIIDELNTFLLSISNNDEYDFVYKFTYDYFKNKIESNEILDEIVYSEHKYERENTSSKLRQECLDKANGECFFKCDNDIFYTNKGTRYLEVHHCVPLSYCKRHEIKGDIADNIIAVCPSCHRRLHYEANSSDIKIIMIKEMLNKLELENYNNIGADEVLQIYNN